MLLLRLDIQILENSSAVREWNRNQQILCFWALRIGRPGRWRAQLRGTFLPLTLDSELCPTERPALHAVLPVSIPQECPLARAVASCAAPPASVPSAATARPSAYVGPSPCLEQQGVDMGVFWVTSGLGPWPTFQAGRPPPPVARPIASRRRDHVAGQCKRLNDLRFK